MGYTSWTICVTVSGIPPPKSLAHPLVTLDTTVARVSLLRGRISHRGRVHGNNGSRLQNPVEQRPVSQLLTVSGTDWSEPTKKESREEGLRHAASGEARIAFKESMQPVERLPSS